MEDEAVAVGACLFIYSPTCSTSAPHRRVNNSLAKLISMITEDQLTQCGRWQSSITGPITACGAAASSKQTARQKPAPALIFQTRCSSHTQRPEDTWTDCISSIAFFGPILYPAAIPTRFVEFTGSGNVRTELNLPILWLGEGGGSPQLRQFGGGISKGELIDWLICSLVVFA